MYGYEYLSTDKMMWPEHLYCATPCHADDYSTRTIGSWIIDAFQPCLRTKRIKSYCTIRTYITFGSIALCKTSTFYFGGSMIF
mmetsp:Transcript_7902/g.21377  ORF Transcript_7902/g.21377 Transcript_7902/m.21377 type:complete len:83 (+) Transcript_7902:1011-1259(+)